MTGLLPTEFRPLRRTSSREYPADAADQGRSPKFTYAADLVFSFVNVQVRPPRRPFQADDAGSIPVGRSRRTRGGAGSEKTQRLTTVRVAVVGASCDSSQRSLQTWAEPQAVGKPGRPMPAAGEYGALGEPMHRFSGRRLAPYAGSEVRPNVANEDDARSAFARLAATESRPAPQNWDAGQ